MLRVVDGDVEIYQHSELLSLNLPLLAAVGGLVRVSDNVKVSIVALPLLRTVTGSLGVTNNSSLRQCLVDAIKLGITMGPSIYVASGNNGMPNTCP
jgi:hypothetical protein